MIDLAGKSAVVTGGSRGIGRAIAIRLAAQGADVAARIQVPRPDSDQYRAQGTHLRQT